MARTTVPLTLDLLERLDPPCRDCVFWERAPVQRAGLDRDERIHEKELWLSEVLREWGSAGRVALVDGDPAGGIIYAPEPFWPGAAAFPTAPVSPDAVLLTSVWVDEQHTGGGLARLLVQAMARDLVGREGVRAIEAFGRTGSLVLVPDATPHCIIPAEFLARVGFKTVRPHPATPRLRMEMRSLATWRDWREEVEAAWERLVGAVRRPAPAAQPREARVGGRVPFRGTRNGVSRPL